MKAQTKKTVIIASISLGVLAIVLAIYFIFFWKKNSEEETGSTMTSAGDADKAKNTFPLSYSLFYNQPVEELQRRLNQKLNAAWISNVNSEVFNVNMPVGKDGKLITSLKVDGYFGPDTQAVVQWALGTKDVSEEQFNSLA